jgi:hypothetical protein
MWVCRIRKVKGPGILCEKCLLYKPEEAPKKAEVAHVG